MKLRGSPGIGHSVPSEVKEPKTTKKYWKTLSYLLEQGKIGERKVRTVGQACCSMQHVSAGGKRGKVEIVDKLLCGKGGAGIIVNSPPVPQMPQDAQPQPLHSSLALLLTYWPRCLTERSEDERGAM